MKTTVSLDGRALHELGGSVLVLGVDERAPVLSRTTLDKGTRQGQWITGSGRSCLEMAVLFALRERRDRALRAGMLERINAWAADGGLLRVGHRPGRRLRVVCEALPAAGRTGEWTTEYEVIFRAYDVPYWEDETQSACAMTAKAQTVTLARRGTAPTPLWFTARNTGTARVDSLSIAAGTTRMDFSGLALGAGETLEADEGEDGLQRLRIIGADGGERDAMACRAIESSDELLLAGPRVEVTLSAPQPLAWTLRHRGRYA